MISSETRIKLKRSGIEGRKPTLADLSLGELGINYSDGKIFFRQENDQVGARIIEPGQGADIGKTIFVTVEGNDNNSGLNERDAKRTIKAAAAIAEPGDSIKVYPGQYIEDNPIRFADRVSVEGMELRNVLVTPANPEKDLYQVGEAFHATNHSFVSNQDSRDGAAIITFRPLEGTASDRYFDAARIIRDNLDFIASESVGFLTSGYSGFAAGQRSHDGARAIELNRDFISEEAFQYINSPDYRGPSYVNPDINQCRRDLGNILDGWQYDLISDGNSETTGVGLTYYAPIPFTKVVNITDLEYDKNSGLVAIETDINPQVKIGDKIKLRDIRLDCDAYGNENLITNFTYDNVSGVGTVTLPFLHDISVGETIKLDGLSFDCPPYGADQYGIDGFVYNEVTGQSIISLKQNHNLSAGDVIELRDIQFDCPPYGGSFTNVIDLEYNNVSGTGVVYFADPADLVAGDTIQLYDIKLSCPSYGNAISVTDFQYDNFTGQSEVTTVDPHGLQPGDNVKLEDLRFTCNSYLNQSFSIAGFDYDNQTGLSVVTLNTTHSLVTGDKVSLDGIVFSCDSYVPSAKGISNFVYDETTGVSEVTLTSEHGLSVGETIRLENLTFSCGSYGFTTINVVGSNYDNLTGFVTLDLDQPHGAEVGQYVRLADLEYSCVNSGITTTLFPDGTFGYEFEILSTPSTTSLIANVGVSTIAHAYVGGGTATVGITTTVFPDGTQGFEYTVSDVVDAFTIRTDVGVSTIAHTYVSGGQLFVGFTTTVFPDGTQGSEFDVVSIPASNQIILNVGISTIAHTYVSGGTATTTDTFIPVTAFSYDDAQGTGLVDLGRAHGLVAGDSFYLEDLKFSCDSYRTGVASTITISNFEYDKTTGLSTITLTTQHDLNVGDNVALYDIEFTCVNSGITTTVFPDGSVDNFYPVVATPNPNTIITRVGTSTITHTYDQGGYLQVGITTNIFPDGTRPSGNFFDVLSVPSPTQVLTTVGVSSIAHQYVSGGKFYTGITTNVFPQVFQDPNVQVVGATYDNVTGLLTVQTDKGHGLDVGGEVLLQGLEFSCTSGGQNNNPGSLIFPRNQEVYTVASVVSPTEYTCNIGPSDFAHTYVQGGISTPQNILNAVYDERTGELTVTTARQHGFVKGDKASVVDLIFSCLSGGPNNQPGTLLFPRPTDEFTVVSAAGNLVTLNVGAFPTLVHTYVSGGSLSYGGTTVSVTNAVYNEQTGVLDVTTASPLGVSANQTVVMQGLDFSCNSGGPGNDPGSIVFPRLDVPSFTVTDVVSNVTYVINVGSIPSLPHTYVSGGFSSLKKKANDNNIFRVIDVPSPNKVITNVGVSSIAHDYVGGGNLFVGITTNIFPDGTRNDGSSFQVISALSPNSALINIGVSTIQHNYESGGRMQYGDTNQRQVTAFDYNNLTGIATVSVRSPHGLSAGQNVKLDGLEFTCTNSPGITTTIFPDGTAASFNIYEVSRILSSNTFETFVGRVDFEHTYLRGGSVFVGITTNIFPDGTQGYDYTVDSVISPTEISVNVGVSSIQHEYIRGGTVYAGRSNERGINDFDYDFNSGLALITLSDSAELFTGDLIKLDGLKFECPNSTGITTNIFPDGSIGNLFPVINRINDRQFQLEIGPSPFAHNYVRRTGSAFIGITTNIFPDLNVQPSKLFPVIGVPSPNSLTLNVGVSSIVHDYTGGGKLFVGINTDIFPGDSEVSPRGDTFDVVQLTDEGLPVINVGPSTITHNYIPGISGGQLIYGETAGGELQHITGPGVSEATIAAIDFEKQISKYVINNRPWGSFVVSETARITEFEYNNVSGIATVTASGINVQPGDLLRMSDIQFRCSDEYAGLTTTFFPDNTRPEGQYFTVESRIDEDTFEVMVGTSTIPHTLQASGNVYRYRQTVKDVDYTPQTGLAEITSINHGLSVGDLVEMRDIEFDCPIFSPDYVIENVQYANESGDLVVTTTIDNDVNVGDLIKLDGIQFECPPYGNQINISNFVYDNVSGVSTVTTVNPHGILVNQGAPVAISTASYDNVTGILTVTTVESNNLFADLNSGVLLSNLEFSCDSIPPGITTTIFPENNFIYKVNNVIDSTTFEVNVGVSTIPHTYETGGDVVKVTRSDIKLSNLKLDCPEYGNGIDITNFFYDNSTGNSLVTVDSSHNLTVGDLIKLDSIKFQCPPYGNDFDVLAADYSETTGILTVTTSRNLAGLTIGDRVRMKDLQFDCNSGTDYNIINVFFDPGTKNATLTCDSFVTGLVVGDNVKVTGLEFSTGAAYPDGRDPSLNIFTVLSVINDVVVVNFPLVDEVDPFLNQGTLTVGITTNIFPEDVDAEGGIYDVLNLPAPNQITLDVGISTIAHTYVRNGHIFTGVTTNFFPGDKQNSPKGNIFEVLDIPTANQVRINVGVSSISHVYDSGGRLLVGITTNIFPGDSQNSPNGNIFPVLNVVDENTLTIRVGPSSIPHLYSEGGELSVGITTNIFPGNKQNSPRGSIFQVLEKDVMCPDRFTVNVGPSSITHNYVQGGTVTTGVTTNRFPDGTNGFEFEVLSVTDSDKFLVNVGPSSITHNYVDGGYIRRLEMPVRDFIYDGVTGFSTVSITNHKLNVGDLVKLRDIRFDCDPYGGEIDVTGAVYDRFTGRLDVTTSQNHNVVINDNVKLQGLQFDCDSSGPRLSIVAAVYDETVGTIQMALDSSHGLGVGDNVKLDSLEFTCVNSGITTTIFPDGTNPALNLYAVQSVPTTDSIIVNVGVSTIAHTYVGGGSIVTGITTNIFPGDAQNSPNGSILKVIDTPSLNTFSVDVGTVSFDHTYVRGGQVQTGVTTDIFPDGTQGDFFIVTDVVDSDTVKINSGISTIVHRYRSGGRASKYSTYQSKQAQIVDTSVIRVSGDCAAVGARVEQLAGIVTSIIEKGPSAAPGGASANVTAASYNNANGDLFVTIDRPVTLSANDTVSIENLLFECEKSTNVKASTYDNKTGLLTVETVGDHGLTTLDRVFLEGLEFSCPASATIPAGSLIYPEDPSVALTVVSVIDNRNYEVQLTPSDRQHTYVKGGTSTTAPSTRAFPDNKVLLYPVKNVLAPNSFVVNVGPSNIKHTYASGGTVRPGLRYGVANASYNNVTGELTITTNGDNYLVKDTGVQLSGLRFSCNSGGPNNEAGTLQFPDGRPANVVDSIYDNLTGLLTVTTDKPHQLYRDAKVRLEGLEFSCPTSGGIPGGSLIYPSDPDKLLRVTKVKDAFTYEVQLKPSTRVHGYVQGGTSDPGYGKYRVAKIVNSRTFTVEMAPINLPHTYVGGGTVSSVLNEQIQIGVNLRTSKCADDIKKTYLAIAHDITRGGNMKSVDAARRYYDAVGQYQFIAGGEVNQTVEILEYSKKIVRCLINNVSWGGVPRGYFTEVQRLNVPPSSTSFIAPLSRAVTRETESDNPLRSLALPQSGQRSVVRFGRAEDKGQFTTEKKFIESFEYDNVTGIATVKTILSHEFQKDDSIRLADIQMRCIGSPRITTNIFPDGTQGDTFMVASVNDDNPIFELTDASYNNTTGIMRVVSVDPMNIPVGSKVNLKNLRFECLSTGSPQVLTYPEDPNIVYEVLNRPSDNELTVFVGISTLAHTFVASPEAEVQELPTRFTVHVGTVNFPHIYEQGGSVWRMLPFSNPKTATQLRDVSQQKDPIQRSNSTPNGCANVFSAIENAVGVVTTIIDVGFEDSGISYRYPGNDGKGVDNIEEMSSQGVGNIIKGPYIRNCTNFVPKSIGMRMDGFDAEPGDEISNGVQGSSNVDSFTQFNPGGIGCSISNGTYQQLVSIFTICCDEAIVCDSGAQLDLTNSNSSFGRLGLVARGIGDNRSKTIDRYTGVVAQEAFIEDDTVVITGIGNKRPYDGQGIYFGELYYEVVSIKVTDGGSGYDDENPPNAVVEFPEGPSGIKAEISPTVRNGVITSIEVIANGNQYLDRTPKVTIAPPKDPNGRTAEATAVTQPLYYDIDRATEAFEGTTTVIFKQRLNNTVSVGTTVYFSRLSLQIASSHSFQYIGAGNSIDGARPSQGGVPIKENEVVKEEGGSIVYTSTDQAGNFNIGDDLVINQFTGTVTGRSFDQSVLNKVTPLIIALDS